MSSSEETKVYMRYYSSNKDNGLETSGKTNGSDYEHKSRSPRTYLYPTCRLK